MSNRKLLFIALIAVVFVAITHADDYQPLDVGNISTMVSNTGVIGYPVDTAGKPSGWWPAGTNDSYIYEADLWISARKGSKTGPIGASTADGRSPEFWPHPDHPNVISSKPGLTKNGKPTGQTIYFKATDDNADQNHGEILGLEVEANGYQWSYAPLYDFFIFEYKVTNVGSDELHDVYMSFRYDIDVSSLETGTSSYWRDDFIALDETPDALNPEAHPNRYMSYGFSNASAPGYIGLRILDAYEGADPNGKKINFRSHRRITIDTDPSTDAEIFNTVSQAIVDPLPSNYDDQRYIQSWGPVDVLKPGQEFNVVIAVAIGVGLEGLRSVADLAQKLYDDEYVAPAPPPSPQLTAYPGDGEVTLVWNSKGVWLDPNEADPEKQMKGIEDYRDITDSDKIFEGYRVYRRSTVYDATTGSPKEEWEKLSEFDRASSTGNYFTVAHVGKVSDASISSLGEESYYSDFFTAATYLVKFLTTQQFEVINLTRSEVLAYDAEHSGKGFTVMKDLTDFEPEADGTYRAGQPIYFGGLYIQIDGDPQPGDIFRIVSTPSQALGEDHGLSNHFKDGGLTNGITYTYAVTSFDRGNPKTGMIQMESSKNDTMVRVVPRSNSLDYEKPSSNIEHVGKSDGEVTAEPIEPDKVTGHTYKVTFGEDSLWTLTDTDTGAAVLEGQHQSPDPQIIEGLLLLVNGPTANIKGKEISGSGTGSTGSMQAYMGGRNANHHDYEIRFTAGGGKGVICYGEVGKIIDVPFEMWDIGYGTVEDPSDDLQVWPLFYDINKDVAFNEGDYIVFSSQPFADPFPHAPDEGQYWGYDPGDPVSRSDWTYRIINGYTTMPQIGDNWQFISTKPNTPDDVFTIATSAEKLKTELTEDDLSKITVVPNPYFVTNDFVTKVGTDEVHFTSLPNRCTIRIYTLAGDLIQTIDHEGGAGFDADDPNGQGDKSGTEPFDLLTYNRQAIASGVYIFHVEALDSNGEVIGNRIGRFSIIR